MAAAAAFAPATLAAGSHSGGEAQQGQSAGSPHGDKDRNRSPQPDRMIGSEASAGPSEEHGQRGKSGSGSDRSTGSAAGNGSSPSVGGESLGRTGDQTGKSSQTGGDRTVEPTDSNHGDDWVDVPGRLEEPGHEMDSHLPCGLLDIYGSFDADAGGTFTISSWPPTGDRSLALSGVWNYSGPSRTTQVVASFSLKSPGHYRLTLDQDPVKHKTFWVECPPPPGGGSGGGSEGGPSGGPGGGPGSEAPPSGGLGPVSAAPPGGAVSAATSSGAVLAATGLPLQLPLSGLALIASGILWLRRRRQRGS